MEGLVGQTLSLIPFVLCQVDSIEDEVQRRLQLVQAGQAEKLAEKERNELRKRKLLTEVCVNAMPKPLYLCGTVRTKEGSHLAHIQLLLPLVFTRPTPFIQGFVTVV